MRNACIRVNAQSRPAQDVFSDSSLRIPLVAVLHNTLEKTAELGKFLRIEPGVLTYIHGDGEAVGTITGLVSANPESFE